MPAQLIQLQYLHDQSEGAQPGLALRMSLELEALWEPGLQLRMLSCVARLCKPAHARNMRCFAPLSQMSDRVRARGLIYGRIYGDTTTILAKNWYKVRAPGNAGTLISP